MKCLDSAVKPKYFKGVNFHRFQGFLNNLKILIMKILSCVTILYYLFGIHNIFITKFSKPGIHEVFNP